MPSIVQRFLPVARHQFGAKRLNHTIVAPFLIHAKTVQRRGRFHDLANTFPRLLTGQAAQFAESIDLAWIIKKVPAKDRRQAVFWHVRCEDEEDEAAFRAIATPEVAVVPRDTEIAIAARKGEIEAGFAGKDLSDFGFGERAQQGEGRQFGCRFCQHLGKQAFEAKAFRMLVIDQPAVERPVAFTG